MSMHIRCLEALRALVASAEIVASKMPPWEHDAAKLQEDAELGREVLDRYDRGCELDSAILGAMTQPF